MCADEGRGGLQPGDDRVIINVASVAGQIGSVTTGIHYAASKGAILAITRSFARALANGKPPHRIRAYYPEIRITITSFDKVDSRLSFGHVSSPGTYATTVTRPALFAGYLAERSRERREAGHANPDLTLASLSKPGGERAESIAWIFGINITWSIHRKVSACTEKELVSVLVGT